MVSVSNRTEPQDLMPSLQDSFRNLLVSSPLYWPFSLGLLCLKPLSLALVAPIFKKGDKISPVNYIPHLCLLQNHGAHYAQSDNAAPRRAQYTLWCTTWVQEASLMWDTATSHTTRPLGSLWQQWADRRHSAGLQQGVGSHTSFLEWNCATTVSEETSWPGSKASCPTVASRSLSRE